MVWLSPVINLILTYLKFIEFTFQKGLFLFVNKKGRSKILDQILITEEGEVPPCPKCIVECLRAMQKAQCVLLLHMQVALKGQCIPLQLVLKKYSFCKSSGILEVFPNYCRRGRGKYLQIKIFSGENPNQMKVPPVKKLEQTDYNLLLHVLQQK